MPRKPHHVSLYLNRELYLALVNYQAILSLGAPFAALRLFTVGAHLEGLIDDETYFKLLDRYGEPLCEETEEQRRMREISTIQVKETVTKREITMTREIFRPLIKELQKGIDTWQDLTPQKKTYYLDLAKKNPDLTEAKKLLSKKQ